MLQALRERWTKRTTVHGLIVVTLVSLFGLRFIWFNSDMWLDPENLDTRVLIQTIRAEQEPLKWFTSDWPLYNGFYRPLPAVSFEIDDRLYENNLRMYCFTNWWIGLFCAFGVVWLVYEVFRNRGAAVASGILFAGWQSGLTDYVPFEWVGGIGAIVVVLYGSFVGGGWKASLVAAALMLFAARELANWIDVVDVIGMDFSYRAIGWPVGRTATIASMFALPCVAAYCRWERVRTVGFAVFSIICLILAMMSYEQIVVVPALLLGSAIALRFQGVQVRWIWHLLPWGLLVTYLYLHSQFLPKSRYHDQAYRGVMGGIRDLITWAFPATFEIKFLPTFFSPEIGAFFLLLDRFWKYLIQSVSCAVSYLSFRPHWLPLTYGLVASTGAYAPMAFQQPLVHYHHLPLAFRAPFVVWLVILTSEKIRIALKRQSAS